MTTTTLRSTVERLVAAALDALRRLGRADNLADLDDRTLADMGISRSEIASIEAESRGRSRRTRRRIAAETRHA